MTIVALALGAIQLMLACVALLRPGPRPRLGRGLAVYLLASAAWMASQAAWYQAWLPQIWPGFSSRLPLYSLFLLAILFSMWVRAYLELNRNPGWLFGAALLTGVILLDANPMRLPEVLWQIGPRQVLRLDFLLSAIVIGWSYYLGQATIGTLRVYRRASQPFFRNRVKYLAVVLVFMVTGEIIFLARYWNLGSLIHLLAVVLAAYAVLTQRLPSLRRGFARSVSYLLTRGLAVAFFAGTFWLGASATRFVLGDREGLYPWLVYGGMAAMLVLLALPLLNRLQELIDRRVTGASHDLPGLLRQYSQSISNVLDVRLLAITAINLIESSLGTQKGDLFLVDKEKNSAGSNLYRLRSVLGPEAAGKTSPDIDESAAFSLEENHPAVIYFSKQRVPVSRQELQAQPSYPTLPTGQRLALNNPDMEIYLPIHAKGEWIGLLGLGPKSSGEPYWDDERFALSALADQTAVALENARLVESLMRLNNEFRRAIEALNQANHDLERLDTVKTDFISIASHELITPLTVLSGYSQMLTEDSQLSDNPYYDKIITGIQTGTQRLKEIVEGMLDLAKIDSHALQLDPQPVFIETLVRSLQEELQPTLSERRQGFEQRNLDGLPSIEADADAIRKVFYHLLVNAIKYTPDGGRIIISGRAIQPLSTEFPRGGVQVTVTDNGVGIDPAAQELIFTKFFQTGELALHSSGRTKFKGSGPGLGLAITRGIVDAHGGRVWVESPGYDENTCPGSQFHVLLPLYQERKTSLKTALSV